MTRIKSTHDKVNDKCIVRMRVYQNCYTFSLTPSAHPAHSKAFVCFIVLYDNLWSFDCHPTPNVSRRVAYIGAATKDTFTPQCVRKAGGRAAFLHSIQSNPNTFTIFIAFHPFSIKSVAET